MKSRVLAFILSKAVWGYENAQHGVSRGYPPPKISMGLT